jgi:ABC-type multidrug transport system fused ATPase/permease subunit
LFFAWLGGRMAHKLHRDLLERVTNAPINLFFDITPLGKLMGNFGGDMRKVDTQFFNDFQGVAISVSDCVVKIIFAIYFSPLMIFAVSINLVWLFYL